MKTNSTFVFALFLIGFASQLSAAENTTKYPAPRFPSYLKPPKSIEDVMTAQADLVEVVHTLRQVVCVKG